MGFEELGSEWCVNEIAYCGIENIYQTLINLVTLVERVFASPFALHPYLWVVKYVTRTLAVKVYTRS